MTGITSDRTIAGRLELRGFAPPLDPFWDQWMNTNLLRLSAMAQLTVLSQTVPLPDPSITPQGSIYIVPSTAAENANSVAIFDGGAYTFIAPWPGLLAFDVDTSAYVRWDDEDAAWVPLLSASSGGTTLPGDLSGLAGQRFVVNADEDGVVPQFVAYDIPLFVGGLLEPNGGISFLISRDMFIPANLSGSLAMLQVPPDAPLDITVRKNGTTFGTCSFTTGAPGGTFTGPGTATLFTAGDLIQVQFPDPQNATASGLSLTLLGNQL